MSVAIRADREGNHARLVPTGPFDLAHATMAAQAAENAGALAWLAVARSDVDLAELERIDGAGAVLLARLLDRSWMRAAATRASLMAPHRRRGTLNCRSYRELPGGAPRARPTRRESIR